MPDADQLAVLRCARELVSAGWCQEAFARDERGRGCGIYDPGAVSFCVQGSVYRAGKDTGLELEGLGSLKLLALRLPGATSSDLIARLATWNDEAERTQDDVLGLFSLAIEVGEDDAV